MLEGGPAGPESSHSQCWSPWLTRVGTSPGQVLPRALRSQECAETPREPTLPLLERGPGGKQERAHPFLRDPLLPAAHLPLTGPQATPSLVGVGGRQLMPGVGGQLLPAGVWGEQPWTWSTCFTYILDFGRGARTGPSPGLWLSHPSGACFLLGRGPAQCTQAPYSARVLCLRGLGLKPPPPAPSSLGPPLSGNLPE